MASATFIIGEYNQTNITAMHNENSNLYSTRMYIL
jgi:hypothetical protein